MIPRVPAGHRAIAVDLPGHGRSEITEDGSYAPAVQAGCIAALLDELQVTQATVVGHGMGCEIATDLAMRTDRVRSLLLISPAGSGQRTPATPARGSAAWMALRLAWRWSGAALFALRRHLAAGYTTRAIATRSLDRHLQWFRSRTRRAALAAQLADLPLSASTVALRQPFEIVVGGADPFVSMRRVSKRFLSPGKGILTTLGPERHFLPEEAPDAVARLLARLLRD
jgi:pimeloyl-ACP methyl ester carboxylesterase